MTADELKARGYRRVSNRYLHVARVDRPDWVDVMARHLKRAPADFYIPGEPDVAPNWCDYYRRVLSKDVITVDADVFRRIPGSDWDKVGYVE